MTNTQKRWLYFFLAALFIFIVSIAINQLFNPPAPEIEQSSFQSINKNNTISNFSNLQFTGVSPNFPRQVSVAQVISLAENATSIERLIINEFNLEQSEFSDAIWLGSPYALTKGPGDSYDLVLNTFEYPTNTGIQPSSAESTAQSFLNQFFNTLSLELISDRIRYYENPVEPEETTAENASLSRVPFAYTIDGIPVFYQHEDGFPFEVWLDSSLTVRRLNFYPQFIRLQPVGRTSLISIDQAIENVNQRNLGSIILSESGTSQTSTFETIISGTLETVTLEYRVDSPAKIAYPFYRFSGTINTGDGLELTAQIITPAVAIN